MRKHSIKCLLFAWVLMIAGAAWAQPENVFTHRYITLDVDMWDRGTTNEELFPVVTRAAEAGYNGIMLGGVFFDMDRNSSKAKGVAVLKKLVAHGKSLNLEVIPWSLTQGDAAVRDSFLVEAFEVKGTPFQVSDGEGRVVQDPKVSIKNGGFEESNGPVPADWRFIGSLPEVDKTVKQSGDASIRYDDPNMGTHMRQAISGLKPFRAYELSVWIKTKDYTRFQAISFLIMRGGHWLLNRRDHGFCEWSIQRNQGWKKHTIDFNSLASTSLTVVLRLMNVRSSTGSAWLDNVQIREVGLYETVRRPGCPVVVRSSDGATVYQEGKDYVVKNGSIDCGSRSDNGLTIPAGSSIKDGQVLQVDWFQHANMETNRAAANFCVPEAWNTMSEIVDITDDVFGNPPGWHVYLDEWRVAHWNPSCWAKYKTAGDYMGWSAGRINDLLQENEALKQQNMGRTIYLMGDMYYPYHNALPNYGLTRGGTHGSWKTLPKSTILVNWLGFSNGGDKCIRFGAGLDPEYPDVFFEQMATGYDLYNTPAIAAEINDSLTAWEEKEGIRGVIGWTTVHYGRNYSYVETVADIFKEGGRWGTGPVPKAPMAGNRHRVRTESKSIVRLRQNAGRITYGLSRNADVKVRVVDILGKTVVAKDFKSLDAGTHRMDLNDLGIPAGLYVVGLSVKANGCSAQEMATKTPVL